MYRGFKIEPISFGNDINYNVGVNSMRALKAYVKTELGNYIGDDGSIDGGKLEQEWFPQIKADIFISHSHQDEWEAISLAGWLYQWFGVRCFVDSMIWSYADTMLKKIDEKHCKNGNYYSYELRNKSTSLVHMVLATAIAKMVDKTECLFFLNTENSITPDSAVNQPETNSPWLYYELGISKLTRKPLSNFRISSDLWKSKQFSHMESLNEAAKFDARFPLSIDYLTNISANDLKVWKNSYEDKLENKVHPLDKLYELSDLRV